MSKKNLKNLNNAFIKHAPFEQVFWSEEEMIWLDRWLLSWLSRCVDAFQRHVGVNELLLEQNSRWDSGVRDGQLQQADRSGLVSVKFDEIELLDGQREQIDAVRTSPLRNGWQVIAELSRGVESGELASDTDADALGEPAAARRNPYQIRNRAPELVPKSQHGRPLLLLSRGCGERVRGPRS